jgi:hypothetical protein
MLCGVPTNGRFGPLIRFRKEVRDIAEEAITTVFEHGAGHPRADFEDERNELARRFRSKYGSHHPSEPGESNVAPYFIGVFDTSPRSAPEACDDSSFMQGWASLSR